MYRLLSDFHTHTPYSHGESSVEENAAAAEKLGMKVLGISDHGPGHLFYGINMRQLSLMKRDVEISREKHPALDIFLGIEANIINPSGKLDINAEEQKLFDYIMAGYHYGVFGESPTQAIGTIIGGYIHNFTSRSTVRIRNHNTDLVLAALYRNSIKILTHPGDKASFDIGPIAKACEDTGTLMEINCHHNGLSVEGIRTAAKYNVGFIIGSDAHKSGQVGRFQTALDRAVKAGLDLKRIVNLQTV